MKVIEPTQKQDGLLSLLLIGHGGLPLGLLSSLKMISGDERNVTALSFEDGDDPDAFGEQIARALDAAPDGCLVLIDLMGGTPFNQFCLNRRAENCQAVCGVNLAMLIEAASAREYSSLSELAQIAAEAGQIGIVDVMKRLAEKRKS